MVLVLDPSLGECLVVESIRMGLHATHMNCSEGDPACCGKLATLALLVGRLCLRNPSFDLCNHCETCYASVEVKVMFCIVRRHQGSIKVDFLLTCGRPIVDVVETLEKQQTGVYKDSQELRIQAPAQHVSSDVIQVGIDNHCM